MHSQKLETRVCYAPLTPCRRPPASPAIVEPIQQPQREVVQEVGREAEQERSQGGQVLGHTRVSNQERQRGRVHGAALRQHRLPDASCHHHL